MLTSFDFIVQTLRLKTCVFGFGLRIDNHLKYNDELLG